MSEYHRICLYQHKNDVGTVHAFGQDHCARDGDPWPCDFTEARMQRDALRAELADSQSREAALQARVDALTAALAFYADKENWRAVEVPKEEGHPRLGTKWISPVGADHGKRATAILAAASGSQEGQVDG